MDEQLPGTGQPSEPAPAAPEAPAPRALLQFENVTKRFGEFAAVEGISLDVQRGEFFALLGPSGCGKTTLMRLVAGFETPDAGRVLLDGRDLAGRPPHLRPVNMMFQSYALFPHMTVGGNIAFGLKQDRLPRREIAERVAAMLELVRLEGLDRRKPHQLSGGQRQRVALARALVKRPKILLLDEPLAALDKKLREETQGNLIALQRELGTTFVVVTHDQEEAMTLAHRIAVMDRGRIAQVGTPTQIYEQPNSRYVASFIGDINLIEGIVVRRDTTATQVDCGAVGYVRLAPPTAHAPGTRVALAVRPEKLRIAAEQPTEPSEIMMQGNVEEVGYRGDMSIYKVRTRGDLLLKVTVPNLSPAAERRARIGEPVWLSWPPDAAILLDR
ncbi:MAG TPA: ABC transporter ATP-binding protein [Woeseiaceae bacterium]|nr:ABC transporter ATP-binding protein [Woeseiaceae bacterium]